ncbi:hypothetical protein MKW94_015495 [Papaver nudicaule]|uniref:Uncharacterized protein n=1 Tax=Papaver nudicaule TaxID=74823 RepID=A0AA41VAY7_PAPNU|nr:hypothetical protein [Papaver nudicaule]
MKMDGKRKMKRNKQARRNWKKKTKTRKLEIKGKAVANADVSEKGRELALYVNDDVGEDIAGDFSLNINDVTGEDDETMWKLKKFNKKKRKKGIWSELLKLVRNVFKECRTAEDLRVKWKSMEAAGVGKEEGEVQE